MTAASADRNPDRAFSAESSAFVAASASFVDAAKLFVFPVRESDAAPATPIAPASCPIASALRFAASDDCAISPVSSRRVPLRKLAF